MGDPNGPEAFAYWSGLIGSQVHIIAADPLIDDDIIGKTVYVKWVKRGIRRIIIGLGPDMIGNNDGRYVETIIKWKVMA